MAGAPGAPSWARNLKSFEGVRAKSSGEDVKARLESGAAELEKAYENLKSKFKQ